MLEINNIIVINEFQKKETTIRTSQKFILQEANQKTQMFLRHHCMKFHYWYYLTTEDKTRFKPNSCITLKNKQ